MNNQQILAALTEIFRDAFDDDSITITNATTADDVEGWDSIAHVNLIVAIESKFHIKFQTAEIEDLRNVGELAALIEKKAR